ncbi:IS4 family transposase [Bacillus toyonensis]|uniref:IS4 family transposase n=1 Tax=Bacillus toyonensis TaxID=155322 RepID=UPI003FA2BB64
MSPRVLEHLAKEKGFVQRKSKYQAKELVALCVWLSQQVASTSLTQLCSYLEVSTGVLISPEGLNRRFNASAVQLLEQVLANLLTQRIHSTKEIIHQYTTTFKHIRILDSTTFQLPDKFSSHYQSSGGSSHTAGVKIQLEYDLLSGKFLHVYVGEGRENDKIFGSTSLQIIRPKDLYIRDFLFKTWKSFFQIDKCKEIKKERLECHLYGQLISMLLCSSTMFKMRQLLLDKKKKELSEYKSIYMIKNYYLLFYEGLQKGIHELLKILLRLFYLLEKNGRKSHRYEKKTVFDILGVVYDYMLSKSFKAA